MNNEAERRLCRALSVWAEREISAMYDEVYQDCYQYFTIRHKNGELEHRKHVTLTGEGIRDGEKCERWAEWHSSPEEAARMLVEHMRPGDNGEIFDAQKAVLVWRSSVEIVGIGDYLRRFKISCRLSVLYLRDGQTFFSGDGKTDIPNLQPLREWVAPSF